MSALKLSLRAMACEFEVILCGEGVAYLEQVAALALDEVERRYILRVLESTLGNKLKAAEILGIDRSTLHRKLKQMQGIAALQL